MKIYKSSSNSTKEQEGEHFLVLQALSRMGRLYFN